VRKLEEGKLLDEFFRPDRLSEEQIEGWMKPLRWMIHEKEGFLDALGKILATFDFQTLYKTWSSIPASIPVGLVWGREDSITELLPCSENIKSVIPHAKLTVLEECGHLIIYEQPEAAFVAIKAFLDEV